MEVDDPVVEHSTRSQRRKARKKLKVSNAPLENSENPQGAVPEPDVAEIPTTEESEPIKQSTKKRRIRKKPINQASAEANVDASTPIITEDTGFTVIGQAKQAKKIKLPPYLPAWYSTPLSISTNLNNSDIPVSSMPDLEPQFAATLVEQGISHFFPVQQTIIPNILSYQNRQRYYTQRPPDLCVCAPTGSGKTLAYTVPILQDLNKRSSRAVRALILVPVKELAVQVADTFQTFAKGTRVKIGLICGKVSLEQERNQILENDPVESYIKTHWNSSQNVSDTPRKSAVDVLIATPGRLVDHLYETRDLDLQSLEYLVVDEADRMIEEFKNNWFRLLERAIFKNPLVRPSLDYTCVAHYEKPSLPLQKLLFSATLSYDPQRFEALKLYRPKLFAAVPGSAEGDIMMLNDAEVIGAYVTPEALKEMSVQIAPALKPLVVLHLLHTLGWKKVLIFTNSLESTHRLYLLIKLVVDVNMEHEAQGKASSKARPLTVQEISSQVHQRKRQASLDGFEKGKIDVIVASDSMARGIDLSNVEYVILYDAPLHPKTYIHRSGRTARAGKAGTVLTMLKPNEKKNFMRLMKELNKKLPEKMPVPPEQLAVFEENYKTALARLATVLQESKHIHN